LNLQALTAFREALGAGIYAGAFVGPHRAPLYPHLDKVKPIPTRRPIILSQEYIDTLNTKLTHAGLPGLTGLYNIPSVDITTSNAPFRPSRRQQAVLRHLRLVRPQTGGGIPLRNG
jgi:hypothetical protein